MLINKMGINHEIIVYAALTNEVLVYASFYYYL